ncbi:stage V sporulation protein B [Caldanaerobius polysaccharolyticus]|uniref:stage V sporulation protein B n=1 Tax=Caldanaerobius polysaccharolyticus TaxID=44256 RepID=UPI00068E8B6A|nr:stage V sporulation protein B [Caldanaerobius polysaccharolyticus]
MVKKKTFIQGAFILTIANFITRIIGFIYRIILSNLIGAEGMGIYQLVFPIYILSLSLVTGGFSVAVSSLVSRESARNNHRCSFNIVNTALKIVISLSLIISLFLLLSSKWLSSNILRDNRTFATLLIFAPAIFIIATSSIIRGFFEGMQDVTPNAIANIIEQVSRVIIVLGLLYFLNGVNIPYSVSSAIAMLGNIAGEIFGFFYLSYAFHRERKIYRDIRLNTKSYFGDIMAISIPLTVNRVIINALSALDNILIPQRLLVAGLNSTQAVSIYGEFTGMAMPLIFFPSIITNSLAVTLIPAISEAYSTKNRHLINRRVRQAVDVSLIIGFLTMAIFLSLPEPIAGMLYSADHVGQMLFWLSFTIAPIFLNQVFASILNGLNLQVITFRNSFIAACIRLYFTYVLVAVPQLGINGYIIGIIISYAILNALDYTSLKKHTNISIGLNSFIYPCLAAFFTYFGLKYSFVYLSLTGINKAVNLLISLGFGCLLYTIILMCFGVITINAIKKLFRIR